MNKIRVSAVALVVLLAATVCMAGGEEEEDGREIFGKLIAAMGGLEKISSLKTIGYDVEVSNETPSGLKVFMGEITMAYPDKLSFAIHREQGDVVQIVNGPKGMVRLPEQRRPMTEQGVQGLQSVFYHDFFYIAQHLSLYTIRRISKGETTIEISFEGPGGSFHCRIDPRTHLADKALYQVPGESGPLDLEEVFSDYREVDGITMYFKTERYVAGKMVSAFRVRAMRINPMVTEDLFLVDPD